MKLSEALSIINGNRNIQETKDYYLVCGFTPLYLETFIKAFIQKNNLSIKVNIDVGVYGSVINNLCNVPPNSDIIIFLEWSDFDKRLSARSLCEWNLETHKDIIKSFKKELDRFFNELLIHQENSRIVLNLPILPILPIDTISPLEEGLFSSTLRETIFEFSSKIAKFKSVSIINIDLIRTSLQENIFDFKNELHYGYPYTISASSRFGEIISKIFNKKSIKKGLITDLDNTCWRGILGDDGLDGISWTLDRKSQGYGLYQQLIKSLSNSGILVAIASKNDKLAVEEALALSEMILKETDVFPIEANWGKKSDSVERILKIWNISSKDVVFIDDNLFEIDEVKSKFPELECINFPKDDTLIYPILLEIRELFARKEIFKEDILRSKSIVSNSKFIENISDSNQEEEMLDSLDAIIKISNPTRFIQDRSLELVNKTNQFNLNGKRYDINEWQALEADSKRIYYTFDYNDKYGPLGQISIISGKLEEDSLIIDIWVLSCRAFSRRIEYKIIEYLFDTFKVKNISFKAEKTLKNNLVFDLFKKLNTTKNDFFILDKDHFLLNKPNTYIKIIP